MQVYAVLSQGHMFTYDLTESGEVRKHVEAGLQVGEPLRWLGTGFAAKGHPGRLFSAAHNVEGVVDLPAPLENASDSEVDGNGSGNPIPDSISGSGEDLKVGAFVTDKMWVLPLEVYHNLPFEAKAELEAFEECGGAQVFEYKTLQRPVSSVVASSLYRNMSAMASEKYGFAGIDVALLKVDKTFKGEKGRQPYPLEPKKALDVTPHDGKAVLALGCPMAGALCAGYMTMGPPAGVQRSVFASGAHHAMAEWVDPCPHRDFLQGMSGGPILVPLEGTGAAPLRGAREFSNHVNF